MSKKCKTLAIFPSGLAFVMYIVLVRNSKCVRVETKIYVIV